MTNICISHTCKGGFFYDFENNIGIIKFVLTALHNMVRSKQFFMFRYLL